MSEAKESPLRVLFLEDNPADVDLAEFELRRAGIKFKARRVETREQFEAQLDIPYDIILADFTLPQFNALEALEIVKQRKLPTPFIVVTGTISEEVAVECIKQGASDYLLKDRLARLPSAVENALHERALQLEKLAAEQSLRESELRYRTLVEVSPDAIAVHDGGKLVFLNPAAVRLIGAESAEELIGRNAFDFLHEDFFEAAKERIAKTLNEGRELPPMEEVLIQVDGTPIDVEIVGGPMTYQGKQVVQLVIRDISARKRRERELRAVAATSEGLRVADDIEEVLQVILQQAAYLVGAIGGVIFLKDEEQGRVIPRDGMGIWGDLSTMKVYPGGPTERVIEKGTPIIFTEMSAENNPAPEYLEDDFLQGLRAMVCIPLQVDETIIGVLWVGSPNRMDDDDVELLLAIGKLGASALQRAFLKEEMETDFLETVLALANTLDVRDTSTADHSQKMAVWAEVTLKELGGDQDQLRVVRLAALLHDIGKIGVPDSILRKPGPLNDAEREIMRRHPDVGAEIVAPISKLEDVAPIIRAHQEKFNGTGYPRGLKGEEIPLAARVLTVVDAFAAMTEDRVYRAAITKEEGITELKRCAGEDFDPQVVEAFIRVLQREDEI